MKKIFLLFLAGALLAGCQAKDAADELDEKLERSQRDFEKHAKKAMEKLDSLQKNASLNKIEPLRFGDDSLLNTGDSLPLKIMIADYDSMSLDEFKKKYNDRQPKHKAIKKK